MRPLTFWLALLATFLISACGGGGGSSGTAAGGTAGPTISLAITDASGNVLTTNAISGGATFFVRALVRSSSNAPLSNQLVTFTTDAAVATLSQPSALTDASGVARVPIAPVTAGAASLTATTTAGGMAATAMIAFQTSPVSVSLSGLSAMQSTVSNLQSTDVSVQVQVGGVPAKASEVSVSFSASCGTFSPAAALALTGGTARSTYTPNPSCAGPVTLNANAPGASTATATVNVAASVPANILFTSVSQSLLVVSSAPNGVKSSTVRFQAVNELNTGIGGQSLLLALDAQSLAAGVTFSVNGSPSTTPQTLVSDGAGFVQAVIGSGSVPTPVVVTASLVSNPNVRASSSGLAVTNGRASQGRISLSATKLSIEAAQGSGTTDGVTTMLTIRIADRLANPVPMGTVVSFVASHGLVTGSCITDGNSACSVSFNTQGPRPDNGLVTILSFLDGEESFTDLNGNNVWDSGEPFVDRGQLFLDRNSSGNYEAAVDQLITGFLPGNAFCAGTSSTVINTCDGTWSGVTRISDVSRIAWASSDAVISEQSRSIMVTRPAMPAATPPVAAQFNGTVTVRIADNRGNSMPVGSSIAVSGCTGATVSPTTASNTINPVNAVVSFSTATDACTLRVTVTSPSAVATNRDIALP